MAAAAGLGRAWSLAAEMTIPAVSAGAPRPASAGSLRGCTGCERGAGKADQAVSLAVVASAVPAAPARCLARILLGFGYPLCGAGRRLAPPLRARFAALLRHQPGPAVADAQFPPPSATSPHRTPWDSFRAPKGRPCLPPTLQHHLPDTYTPRPNVNNDIDRECGRSHHCGRQRPNSVTVSVPGTKIRPTLTRRRTRLFAWASPSAMGAGKTTDKVASGGRLIANEADPSAVPASGCSADRLVRRCSEWSLTRAVR